MTEALTKLGIQDVTTLLGVFMAFIGACAFAVSIVVEGLKSIEAVNRIPTKLTCYIVALILTPVAFVALMAYLHKPVEWFSVFASFLAAFVVAKVSMGGWDDVMELMDKMFKKKG